MGRIISQSTSGVWRLNLPCGLAVGVETEWIRSEGLWYFAPYPDGGWSGRIWRFHFGWKRSKGTKS